MLIVNKCLLYAILCRHFSISDQSEMFADKKLHCQAPGSLLFANNQSINIRIFIDKNTNDEIENNK